jgi:hypothetical protein
MRLKKMSLQCVKEGVYYLELKKEKKSEIEIYMALVFGTVPE